MSAAGETDRPSAVDEARSDYGDFAHDSIRSISALMTNTSQRFDVAVHPDRLAGNIAAGRREKVGDRGGDVAG